MEIKLIGGKYSAGKYSGLERAEGDEETAQRIAMKLTARRGGFPPIPDYGSRLYMLSRVKASERQAAARQYIAEALEGESEAALSDMSITENGGELALRLSFQIGGGETSIETVFEVER